VLYLDKVLAQLAYPLNLSLLLIVLAVVFLLWRKRRLGLSILSVALIWLWFWSMPMVSQALWLSLEEQFDDKLVIELPSADAIVLLGGSVRAAMPPRFNYPDLAAPADRVWQAARLFKADKVTAPI